MKTKKMLAALTAVLCSLSTATLFPDLVTEHAAAEAVHNGFEETYEGWHGSTQTVAVDALAGAGFAGSRGMVVTGRADASEGAASSKGFYLIGGVDYTYNVKVKADNDETFRLSVRTIDQETGEETVKEILTQDVTAGTWTDLSAKYEAPKNAYEFELTLTTDTTNDFQFDEVSITSERPVNIASAATAEKGLKDEFAAYFRVGNILNGGTIQNSAITANIIKDCNSVECENETKPDATLVQSGSSNTDIKVSLNRCAAIMDFCVQNGIGMRGHTMVWHSQTPSWFFKDNFQNGGNWVSSDVMDQRMESYIKNMFNAIKTQYPSLDLYAYDVCNECISDDASRTTNGKDGAREAGDSQIQGQGGKSAWVQVYGNNSFIEKAFTYARKYAPEGCDLYYNDYNEYWDHKRDCIYNMCKNLYSKGLLDGVGMQSHVPANATGFAGTDSYIEAMEKYLSIGCDVQITELDISLLDGSGNVAYNYTDQANKYKAIFQAAMDWNTNPRSDGRVTAVCIWGPNDANSWLKSGSNALLYDKNNEPKEAYTALTSMIPQSEWGDGTVIPGREVVPFEPNEYGWYFHCPFEGDTENWTGRGDATVMTSGRTAYVGSEALLVQNRGAAWHGTARPLSANPFKPGETFSFSVNVSYFDGADTTDFKFTLQYTGSDGKAHYDEIASATGVKGEWVQLANKNYTIPADATNMQIYVETSDESTENFYIDEAIGAVAGTSIQGAGQPDLPVDPATVALGDVDTDGGITIVDLGMAKRGLVKGFGSKAAEKAADVDQSGIVDVTDIVLLTKYIHAMIKEFPVAERAYPQVDFAKMEQSFNGVTAAGSWKRDGENNALYTQRFGADPGFMVYKDRLYVYTTNDAFEYDSNGQIKENSYDVGTINCHSSADLVNWTDHGAIPVAGRNGRTKNGAASWATYSWAPDACWKTIKGKDKFFLYFADSAGGIGVLTADSPTGPWTDPLGHALVNRSTPNTSGVVWMFDPAVMVDDDGTGYLFFGGGVPDNDPAHGKTGRCVKLGDDMISLAGDPVTMDTPYLFEDSSILKIGNTYYYSYCTNWSTGGNPYGFANAQIAYMTSDKPLGPYTYRGIVFKNTAEMGLDKGGNNHHSIVFFKNKYYVLYHTRDVELQMGVGKNYRSPSINECTLGADGSLNCKGTKAGVSQLETLSPYGTVQAETMSSQSKGIRVNGLMDTTVTGGKGDWTKVSGVKFNGTKAMTIRASAKNGAVIKVMAGGTNGDVIGYAQIPAGGSMENITVACNDISGTKDVYFLFSGDVTFDSWGFE
ncbi:MAG: endo-1,4-beta-xylanase [Oscillospiraceae bacterium]|nr:endo-1,4-beta-xylanase [Oscillospiraceae bacterium]